MKQMNKRKVAIIFFMAVGLGSMTVAYQNFTAPAAESLTGESQGKKDDAMSDALTAAMQVAEKEHVQKQMALNVEPSQVESKLRKKREIATVQVQTDINAVDTAETARAAREPALIEEGDEQFLEDAALPGE